MQTLNLNQQVRSDDPIWHFLAEFLLSEFLSDHDKTDELTAGLLFQMMRELSIPPEYLENIEMTLRGFAKEALGHFKQGSLELPGRIRVFCQKKMMDEANSPKTSRLDHVEQAMEHAPIIHHSTTKMNGGWGCFLIVRADTDTAVSSVRTHHLVDLYLYREG